jgi:hypothetical protein
MIILVRGLRRSMQEAVLEDLLADVSESNCKRAKRIVMERIVDGTNEEYFMTIICNW